jgi:2-dehydropantoate 2-reductase
MTSCKNQEKKQLHICIVGAGGIGCYYGARLETKGHHVVYIARGEHLAALQDKGLTLKHPDLNFYGRVTATDLNGLSFAYTPEDFDAIIICVKATATDSVARALKQWFVTTNKAALILSLQNGVDNEPQLAMSLGEKYIVGGLAVRIGGHIISPGEVEATGVAQVILGPWPASGGASDEYTRQAIARLVEAFNQAAIPTRLVENIRHELWRKLIINNGVNPLSALTQLDTRALSHHPELGQFVHKMMQETAQVSAADDEVLTDDDVEEMFELIRSFDPIKTSMLVDFEKGRPLELDAISGVIIRRSEKIKCDVPVTKAVSSLLMESLNNTDHTCVDPSAIAQKIKNRCEKE